MSSARPWAETTMATRALRLRDDVALGRLSLAHADQNLEWLKDHELASNIGLRSTPTLAKTRSFIERATTDTDMIARAIYVGVAHVGNVVLDQRDSYLQIARFSIYLGDPAARGSGVGLTATFRILEEGFGSADLHKIWLVVHPENVRAQRTYERVGFRVEGRHRDEFRLGSRRLDAIYMGILAADFAALRPERQVPS